jgi:hypothetical protein
MPYLVVTNEKNTIKVVFNDAPEAVGYVQTHIPKSNIKGIRQMYFDQDLVEIMDQDQPWTVSHQLRTDALKIDSVDGVAPTDAANLCDMIKTLLNTEPA